MNELLEYLKEKAAKIAVFLSSFSAKMSYAASGSAFAFSWDANTIGAYIAIVIGIATFAVNWYYKNEANKRGEELLRRGMVEKDDE